MPPGPSGRHHPINGKLGQRRALRPMTGFLVDFGGVSMIWRIAAAALLISIGIPGLAAAEDAPTLKPKD